MDPDAEANALTMSPFLKADERGDQGAIIAGQIGNKLGMQWWLDHNVPTHTAAGIVTAAGTQIHPLVAVQVVATTTAKSLTLAITSTTNVGTLLIGDVFTIENNSDQQFVLTARVSSTVIDTGTTITVAFEPYLEVTASASNTITFRTTGVCNMMFHKDAFSFASRPLMTASDAGLGSIFQSAIDPVSGLALRLEVSRQNKMQTWSFDILYGGKATRPELAARLYG